MLIKKNLDANSVNDINTEGQFIKIVNCESEVRVRATNGADVIVDTVARGGFEVHTTRLFTLVQVSSDDKQKAEFWVSKHKLGYDALTKGSNTNLSSLIEHYGGAQKVLPFERSRVAVTLFSDVPFWYGGEGVTVENGIPVDAGKPQKIEGAGELHIAVSAPPELVISADNPLKTVTELTRINYGDLERSIPIKKGVLYSQSGSSAGFGVWFYDGLTHKNVSKVGYEDLRIVGFAKMDNGAVAVTSTGRVWFYDSSGNLIFDTTMPDDNGAGELYPRSRIDAVVNVRTGYMVGVNVSGGGNACYMTVDGLTSKVLENSASTFDRNGFINVDGEIYVSTAGRVYKFSEQSVPTEFSELGEPLFTLAGNSKRFTKNEKFILFDATGSRVLINRDTGEKIPFSSDGHLSLGLVDSIYHLDGVTVRKSNDGFTWVNTGELNESYDSESVSVMVDDKFLILKTKEYEQDGAGFNRYVARRYNTETLKNKPKAIIRMLKEVV